MITNFNGEKTSAKERAKEILLKQLMEDVDVNTISECTEREQGKITKQYKLLQERLAKKLAPKEKSEQVEEDTKG